MGDVPFAVAADPDGGCALLFGCCPAALPCPLQAPAKVLGIPEEVLPLALLRPLSGSGALVAFQQILSQYGPDSFVGRVASVLMGSTETTFYTITLYCSAANIKNSRYAAPASLCADLMGFAASAAAVRLLLG